MKYHKLYVGNTKSFELKGEKNYYFAMCQNDTRQTQEKAHGKAWVCRVPKKKHMTKHEFAMCFSKPGVTVITHDKVAHGKQ